MNALDKYIEKREPKQPPPEAISRFLLLIGIFVVIGGLIVAILALAERPEPVTAPPTAAAGAAFPPLPRQAIPQPANWKRIQVTGVSLESPYGFDEGRDMMHTLPDHARQVTFYANHFSALGTPPDLTIGINAFKYDQVKPEIDGAIRGLIQWVSDVNADENLQYSVKTLAPDRKIVLYRHRRGDILAVVFTWQHHLWSVIVGYKPRHEQTAERIIASARLGF